MLHNTTNLQLTLIVFVLISTLLSGILLGKYSNMDKLGSAFIKFGALSAASAVGIGAFGAHGLKTRLQDNPRADYFLDVWKTGSTYHLIHSFALIAIPFVTRNQAHRVRLASLFGAGIALFSGSLYTLVLTEYNKLGAVTPLGGLALIAGWIAMAMVA